MSLKISEHMEMEMAKFFMRTSVPRILKKRRLEAEKEKNKTNERNESK